jgi:hypothetical protein
MMVTWVSKRSFSFIEIVVVCLILSIASGLCLINFTASIEERKRRLAFEQVSRKIELAKLLSCVLHDRIYIVATGSLPVQIALDTGSRRNAPQKNLCFKRDALEGVSEVVFGTTSSANTEVRIAFCNGVFVSHQQQEALLVRFKNAPKDEIRIPLEDKDPKVHPMSPEEVDRIFPRELLNIPSEVS